jgi:hypothetical protein
VSEVAPGASRVSGCTLCTFLKFLHPTRLHWSQEKRRLQQRVDHCTAQKAPALFACPIRGTAAALPENPHCHGVLYVYILVLVGTMAPIHSRFSSKSHESREDFIKPTVVMISGRSSQFLLARRLSACNSRKLSTAQFPTQSQFQQRTQHLRPPRQAVKSWSIYEHRVINHG